MSLFCESGTGVGAILSNLRRSKDFSACYVLLELESGTPFYVGISRSVIRRLRQHVKGENHFSASLAYRMANNKFPHKMTRDLAMADPEFRSEFDIARALLQRARVAFVEIDNPLELYLFEAYCAMELNTCEWNSFRTH
ncbi:hypothetical protein HNQ77_001584 [Silvibacterium bohemicum]|uniref:GIY-YIG domain-containing protein n=1 Tax=Silvibacterium bohemicum TaxID=1577686 RepID=A0A841JT19_9BACT|nr:hypothetical protein [Silvibacterium bohemicum]